MKANRPHPYTEGNLRKNILFIVLRTSNKTRQYYGEVCGPMLYTYHVIVHNASDMHNVRFDRDIIINVAL